MITDRNYISLAQSHELSACTGFTEIGCCLTIAHTHASTNKHVMFKYHTGMHKHFSVVSCEFFFQNIIPSDKQIFLSNVSWQLSDFLNFCGYMKSLSREMFQQV